MTRRSLPDIRFCQEENDCFAGGCKAVNFSMYFIYGKLPEKDVV
jgi:hypothetical protein